MGYFDLLYMLATSYKEPKFGNNSRRVPCEESPQIDGAWVGRSPNIESSSKLGFLSLTSVVVLASLADDYCSSWVCSWVPTSFVEAL